ncbi:MAG: dihydrofolate reductase family protein [Rhodobacteraceae bacterium]|nr:dihydrofolate reductase family protein [Paracoccaceae bacterium]
MSLIRVESFTVSTDGYGAGRDQSRDAPMGVNAQGLHGWAFATRTFRAMFGQEGGSTGEDDRIARQGFDNIGAWVMGRHMFTPERGAWSDPDWRGWWGETPPYGSDVHVLTHHPKAPLVVGTTTFHFVTEGLEVALERARDSAGGKDVRLGGGVATLREGFGKGLIDRAHIAVSPVLLGGGEPLWHGLDLPALGYRLAEALPVDGTTHLTLRRG